MSRWLNWFGAVCVAAALTACGGETPSGDVTVDVSYSPPNGTVGQAYDYAPHYTASENITETWALTSGALPPGLALMDNNGHIYGTPKKAGTYSFTITLTAKGVEGSVSSSGSITIVSDIVATLTYNAPNGSVGTAYSYTPQVSINKPVTTVFELASFSHLPAGLTLNSATGEISGTPTTPGSYYPQIVMKVNGDIVAYGYASIGITSAI